MVLCDRRPWGRIRREIDKQKQKEKVAIKEGKGTKKIKNGKRGEHVSAGLTKIGPDADDSKLIRGLFNIGNNNN